MADIIGRLGGTYKHPVVDEIPEELRPEEVVFVKDPLASGLWIGASENVFPGLDEGTPHPIKGYRESSLILNDDGTNVTLDVIRHDYSTPPSVTRDEGNDLYIINIAPTPPEARLRTRFSYGHLAVHNPPLVFFEDAFEYSWVDIEVAYDGTNLTMEAAFKKTAEDGLEYSVTNHRLSDINVGDPYYLPEIREYPPLP